MLKLLLYPIVLLIRSTHLILIVLLISVGVTSAYAINITLGGSVFITEILDMMGNRITNVGMPTQSTDVATKGYVDSAINPIPSNHAVSATAGSNVPGCEDKDDCFLPYIILISKGDTIIWTNDDSAAHTVTSGDATNGPDGKFESSLFVAGTTFSHQFDEKGSFPYLCLVHPWSKGFVLVT